MGEEMGDKNRSWRRISTGKLSFLYTEEKNLPNYLRSPTGSCHDVCKYGRKHESGDNKPRASPRKRVSRSFSETLSFDSPLRKKILTKSVLNDSGGDHSIRNFSRRKKSVSFSESELSDSFKTSEHKKRVSVTALKLKSVAQTAAMVLQRSTVKTNGGSKASEPKNGLSSHKCKNLVEEKTLCVIKMKTKKEIVESDQNQKCVMDSPTNDPESEKSQDNGECIVTEANDEEDDVNGKSLKHQDDSQKKRDSRVLLLNKVIKETANKLVETRKSKVKALVAAFESVIQNNIKH